MSQYGEPDHYILHVSDTHFVTDGTLLHDSVDSDANLSRLFERLERAGRRPEAIVFTGDLADRGEPEAYVRLRRIVEPAAERLGAKVIWVMGNHDARPAFRSGLLDAEPTQDSVDSVVDVNGSRIIVLDSTVPGHHHGLISDEQLAWLTGVLAEPAPHGTLLALHHPPVPGLLDAIESVELKEQHRLETVLAGTDVRGILAGHLHFSTTCTFAGIPVSVASATCYTQDLLVDRGSIRGQDGAQGFNMVHVYRDRVLHTVVPLDVSPTVYEMTADEIPQSIEQLTAPGI
ncbi:phosphodiesterase [Rhodococcus wratislaviensis]|uniref:Putative 3',5'-cyclic-nucleotide phosphodiesterase n=1 Tax=Rhodococcus wratislaviensis NBRC 100605 TaxID=1219028 RepID=X0Q8L0_RHOWR|nr:phosphodiesterase [Rhodococcus wratislaviensis]GAF47216.1 putative 3',5'-cyclic-nucleotide phosphodiesterase [Rhodococcus wratislaviensis NBRC 100605]